ncbi:MAG: pentapeptide repeat-containing protein [Pseudonocardiaceae bacterium]
MPAPSNPNRAGIVLMAAIPKAGRDRFCVPCDDFRAEGDDLCVTTRSNRPGPPTPRPLSNWLIAAGALVVLGVVAVIWFVLLRRYGGQGTAVQLAAIRTAGTLVIGTGGAVALLLTARRQRYTELTLVHTDRDATERRITELYTKAADQLGSEQAPVRLAGLYALERLAHSTIEHRQSIVDVICAYLRMPYTPPLPQASASVLGRSHRSTGHAGQRPARRLTDWPSHRTPASQGTRQEHAEQELQVRLTAQNILVRNLRVVAQQRRRWWHRTVASAAPAWPGIRLDLTGALLHKFSLAECRLDYADFTRAKFADPADFGDTQFTSSVFFTRAHFTDWAFFGGAEFTGPTNFQGAQFTGPAYFDSAQFARTARFEGAQFTHGADFGFTHFATALFVDTQFTHGAYFGFAQFAGASFGRTQFTKGADFEGAQFAWGPYFAGARVASTTELGAVWPSRWTIRPAKPKTQEDPTFLYLTEDRGGAPPDP